MITFGYGEKYQGFIRCLPNSIISTFFIFVTSSWLDPDVVAAALLALDIAVIDSGISGHLIFFKLRRSAPTHSSKRLLTI